MSKIVHGMWKSTEWNSWDHMKRRCYNPNDPKYSDYGGRGIGVCERWLGKDGFANFYADMGPKPSLIHTLDRFPNNETGWYEPGNTRWATPTQQSNNRRKRKIGYKWKKYRTERW